MDVDTVSCRFAGTHHSLHLPLPPFLFLSILYLYSSGGASPFYFIIVASGNYLFAMIGCSVGISGAKSTDPCWLPLSRLSVCCGPLVWAPRARGGVGGG